MKSHLTLTTLILLLTCILPAGAIPTFTVIGSVTDAENQPAPDGLNVGKSSPVFVVGGEVTDEEGNLVADGLDATVTNETLSLTKETKLGQNTKAGSYVVAFVATDKDTEFVVQTGDTLKVTLKDAAGNILAQKSHQVNDDEIANTRAIINLQITGAVKPGPAATIELVVTPDSLFADGKSKAILKATVRDRKGLLVRDETVTMKITKGGGKISAATNNDDGTYTAEYTAGTAVETVTISATTSNNLQDTAEILFLPGPVKYVTVKTNHSELLADGKSQATITITVEDANRNPISDAQVKMKRTGSGSISPDAIHKGGGTYEAIYTAGKEQGDVVITATVNSVSSETKITLTVKPPVSLTLEPSSGNVGTAVTATGEGFEPGSSVGGLTVDGITISVIGIGTTVVVGDENIRADNDGRFAVRFKMPKGRGGNVLVAVGEAEAIFEIRARISVSPQSGVAGTNITLRGDGFAREDVLIDFGETEGITSVTTLEDGSFEATFEADVQKSGKKQIKATGDLSERSATTDFELLKSIAKTVVIKAEPTEIVANGESTATLTITVKDDGGRPVIEEDITITPQLGTATPAIHRGDGVYTATYTSSAKAGSVKILATTSNNLTADTFLTLTPGPAAAVTVEANPSVLPGDGESESRIMATVKDAHGNPVSDEKVTMTAGDAGGTLKNEEGETGTTVIASNAGNGTYTATYISAQIAVEQTTATVTARTQNSMEGKAEIILSRNPDFSLNAEDTTKVAQPGEPLIYFIEVTGQNGFLLPVELETKGLPEDVKSVFSPDEVTPTVEKPKVDSQLELRIPETIGQGEYTFSVRGISPDAGLFRKLKLSFTVEKVESKISLVIDTKEIPLDEKVKVNGQVLLQEGDERTNLEIELTYQFSGAESIKRIVRTEGVERGYFDEFIPDKLGSWKVKASWAGDSKYQGSARETEFQVIKGLSSITLTSSNKSPKLGAVVTISGELIPRLSDAPVSLKIEKPDGIAADIEEIKTEGPGSFQYEILLDQKGDWAFRAVWGGNENYESSSSEKLKLNVVKELGKAIIVLGGGNESTNDAWDIFNGVANRVYTAFKRRRLTDDDIYFLSPSLKPDKRVDVATSLLELERAITQWASRSVNAYVPLYIYLLSHNLGENFLLEEREGQQVFLTPQKLDEWLDKLEDKRGTQIFLIFEACHSGKFITAEKDGKPILPRWDERQRRIIIASAREDEQARLLRNLSSFSRYFFEQIERNVNLREAFVETEERLKNIPYHSSQFPQMDANGDGIPNEHRDYVEVGEIYIPDFITSLPAIPEISQISPKQSLKGGETSAKISVKVLGANITDVYGTVIPPDFDARKIISSWEELAFDELKFLDEGDGKYTASYDRFSKPGEYHIIVYAENPDGASEPVQTTVVVKGPWDVNDDGEVDIVDLVLVGSNFGREGENIKGDVNGDGRVDIKDLTLVGRHFGVKRDE